MSENNKTVELNEGELERITGGIVGGTATDGEEFIGESKESDAKSAKERTPVLNAGKAYNSAIK